MVFKIAGYLLGYLSLKLLRLSEVTIPQEIHLL